MEWLIATAPITKARTKHPCSGPPPGRRSSAKASAGTEAAPTDRIFKRRRKAERQQQKLARARRVLEAARRNEEARKKPGTAAPDAATAASDRKDELAKNAS